MCICFSHSVLALCFVLLCCCALPCLPTVPLSLGSALLPHPHRPAALPSTIPGLLCFQVSKPIRTLNGRSERWNFMPFCGANLTLHQLLQRVAILQRVFQNPHLALPLFDEHQKPEVAVTRYGLICNPCCSAAVLCPASPLSPLSLGSALLPHPH